MAPNWLFAVRLWVPWPKLAMVHGCSIKKLWCYNILGKSDHTLFFILCPFYLYIDVCLFIYNIRSSSLASLAVCLAAKFAKCWSEESIWVSKDVKFDAEIFLFHIITQQTWEKTKTLSYKWEWAPTVASSSVCENSSYIKFVAPCSLYFVYNSVK